MRCVIGVSGNSALRTLARRASEGSLRVDRLLSRRARVAFRSVLTYWIALCLVPCIATTAFAQATLEALPAPPTATARPILALDSGGHTGQVNKAVLTAYGDQIISVSHDKTIRFWDVATGEPLRVLRPPIGPGFQGDLYSLSLAPDGNLLAVAGSSALLPPDDHRVLLIALPEGNIIGTLRGHTRDIRDVEFASTGKRLASASRDGTVRLWDISQGVARVTVQVLAGHTDEVCDVAWNPEGTRLVSISLDRTARLWSGTTGQAETVIPLIGRGVATAWSPDGRSIATGDTHEEVRLFETNGTQRYAWHDLGNTIDALAFSKDSQQLLYTWGSRSSSEAGVAILDMRDAHQRARLRTYPLGTEDGFFMPDGKMAVTVGDPDDVCLWKTDDSSVVRHLRGKGRSPWSAAWSNDGQAIAWGNTNAHSPRLARNPIERTFCLRTLSLGPPPNDSFRRAQLRLGNDHLDFVSRRETVTRGWRHGAHISDMVLPDSNDRVRCYTLLPGDRAAVGSMRGLYIFETTTGKLVRQLVGHSGTLWGVAPSPDNRYLLSASMDQTVAIWDWQRGELILQLFVAGDEWIAWTPQGYYAASLAGEGLMGWQVNNGPEAMADFYPAAQFRSSLYRPDVISRLIDAGSWQRALQQADQQLAHESIPIVLSAALPPTVKLTSPAESKTRLSDSRLTISATAQPSGKDPITGMRLLIDGRPAELKHPLVPAGDAPTDRAPAVSETWTVEIPPGRHQLSVKAETAKSYSVSVPVEVEYAPEKAGPPTLYVLAIGISSYPTGGPLLHYADRDAHALAALIEQKGRPLFGQVVVRVLTDRQATQEAIQEGFAWLRQTVTSNDVAIVFYAGQGRRDGKGEFQIVPAPDGTGVEPAGIPASEIKRSAQATRGKLLMWIDARGAGAPSVRQQSDFCHQAVIAETNGQSLTEELLRDLASDDYGVHVMGSATGRESPLEYSQYGQGAFAQALIEGLGGRADANKDGQVTMTELEAYVKERVKQMTHGAQHPVTSKTPPTRSFPLVKP